MAVLKAWWRFFWRYLILLFSLLVIGGLCINMLGKSNYGAGLSFITVFGFGFCANMFSVIFVLFHITGRVFGHSEWMIDYIAKEKSRLVKLKFHLFFFATFIFLSLCFALVAGAGLPLFLKLCGINPLKALEQTRYLGLFVIIPASLLTFWGFIRFPRIATLSIRNADSIHIR